MNKKKLLSLSLSFVLTAGLFSGVTAQAQQYYTDVEEGHWAYEWVDYMAEKGYIHGYPDGNYRPGQNITRAEFVTILNYIFKSEGTTSNRYSDVIEGDWYYDYIHAAVANGYLHGYDDATDIDDGTMKPNNFLTREEAAVIVAGAYDLKLSDDVSKFPDANQISEWAIPYVGAMSGNEILMGDADTSNFRPKDYMLRAEVATMIGKAAKKDDEGTLEKNETVTLPSALTETDGNYALKGITTKNIPIDKQLVLSVDAIANGAVGAYKVKASIDGVVFADNVTLDALKELLATKLFSAADLEKLSIEFTAFENPADGSSLDVTVSVTDTANSQVYAKKEYQIAFGTQVVTWPNAVTSGKKSTILGINTNYDKDMILDLAANDSGSVGSYTLTVTLDGVTIADGVTIEQLSSILGEKKIDANSLKSLSIVVDAPNAANNSSLTLTLKLLDAESRNPIGPEKIYEFKYSSGSSSGSMSGGGSSVTPVSTTRDRVVESLKDYQQDLKNSSSSKQIANDWNKHRISDDMLKVILTNDGMNTFDDAASQTKDSKEVDTVFASLSIQNNIDGGSAINHLYPIYEDVIKYVLENSPSYKNAAIATNNKEDYVYLFRAMVETINGSAAAAMTVYNNPANAGKTADEKFTLFTAEAGNNTTDALNHHISSLDATEKTRILGLAIAYCTELFNANRGEETLKNDLAAHSTVTLSDFATILKKYI